MVTKVVTANDVDNVTIVINGENKLQAKLPATTPSEVVIEEVPDVTAANAVVTVNGVERKISKLGKVNGTNWLVFQLDSLPPASKPTIEKNITIEFYDDVITGELLQVHYEHGGKVRIIVEDGSEFIVSDNLRPWQGAINLNYQGDNESANGVPAINFVDRTYQAYVSYTSPQSTSALQSASGTDSFMVETDNAVYKYTITAVSVAQPEPLPIITYLDVKCGEIADMGDHFEVDRPPVVRVTANDMQGKIPQSVKFDVTVGNETRTYSYPYSESNEYEWNNIADFSHNTSLGIAFLNAVFVFTDGQSIPATSPAICPFMPGHD